MDYCPKLHYGWAVLEKVLRDVWLSIIKTIGRKFSIILLVTARYCIFLRRLLSTFRYSVVYVEIVFNSRAVSYGWFMPISPAFKLVQQGQDRWWCRIDSAIKTGLFVIHENILMIYEKTIVNNHKGQVAGLKRGHNTLIYDIFKNLSILRFRTLNWICHVKNTASIRGYGKSSGFERNCVDISMRWTIQNKDSMQSGLGDLAAPLVSGLYFQTVVCVGWLFCMPFSWEGSWSFFGKYLTLIYLRYMR